jgi:hypothetical protein
MAMKLKFSPCGCSSSWVENVSNKNLYQELKSVRDNDQTSNENFSTFIAVNE